MLVVNSYERSNSLAKMNSSVGSAFMEVHEKNLLARKDCCPFSPEKYAWKFEHPCNKKCRKKFRKRSIAF